MKATQEKGVGTMESYEASVARTLRKEARRLVKLAKHIRPGVPDGMVSDANGVIRESRKFLFDWEHVNGKAD